MQLKETKIKWWMRKDGTGRRRTAKKLLYPEINGAITGILLESKKKRACGNYNLRSFRFPPPMAGSDCSRRLHFRCFVGD
jgi:hypothetical protein